MTRAAEHTPGPWEVRGEGCAAKVFSTCFGHGLIASPTGCEVTRPVNARLIAAAPDMLDVLLTIADYVGDVANGHLTAVDGTDLREMAREDQQRIKAAIAKAQGDGQ